MKVLVVIKSQVITLLQELNMCCSQFIQFSTKKLKIISKGMNPKIPTKKTLNYKFTCIQSNVWKCILHYPIICAGAQNINWTNYVQQEHATWKQQTLAKYMWNKNYTLFYWKFNILVLLWRGDYKTIKYQQITTKKSRRHAAYTTKQRLVKKARNK